jgi:Flp pilus assembly protein CpaB
MVELSHRTAGGGARGLIGTRRGTIVVAAVCAIAAGGIIIYALNKYRQNLSNGNTPETVLVASTLIQKGASGNAIAAERLIKPTSIVAKQVTAGAFADPKLMSGKVATTDIYPGQQLTLSDFAPGAGVTATLGASQRAIEVPIQAAPGLTGNLSAGDYVDIYVSLGGNNAAQAAELRLLATNVRVLQPPSTGGGGLGTSGQTGNLTLAVDDGLAPKLMFAADNGKLWLALRPGNAANPGANQVVTLSSLILGNVAAGASNR